MKKRLSMVVVLMLAVMLVPLAASAADSGDIIASGECGENASWEMDYLGRLTVSGTGEMSDNFYLSQNCNLDEVKEIIIGEGITRIGAAAFQYCRSVEYVELPDSLQSIGDYAFCHCIKLKDITIPDSVTTIGEGAFKQCYEMTSVVLPDSVTTIGESAFEGCQALTSINIPAGVTKIEANTFSGCGITEITIPDGVTSIGEYAFYGTNLTSVIIPEGVTEIGAYVFWYSTLTSITISGSVTEIGRYAFYLCTDLTEVILEDGITSIGEYAFCQCYSLRTLVIPGSVTTIEPYAFYQCFNLSEVTLSDGLVTIGDNAFDDCRALYRITIPESVAEIGRGAFQSCSKLEIIDFLGNAPRILPGGFNWVDAAAHYPDGDDTWTDRVKNDYGGALVWFNKAERPAGDIVYVGTINTADFGKNVRYYRDSEGVLTVFGSGEIMDSWIWWSTAEDFYGTSLITKVVIEEGITRIGKGAFAEAVNLTEAVLPAGLSCIGQSAFEGCTALTSVVIPDTVTNIESSTFYNCSKLSNVTILGDITNIGDNAFYNCSSLTSIEIPDSVTSIGSSAFYNCSSLTSIVIPDSVTSLGGAEFADCTGLTNVTLTGNVSEYNSTFRGCTGLVSIVIPDGVAILDGTFVGCTNLTDVTLPDSITYLNAFDYCYNLSQIEIPNSVTYLRGFKKTSLTNVTIPASVTEIGFDTFLECENLESIHFLGDAPYFDERCFGTRPGIIGYYPADNPTWTEDAKKGDYGQYDDLDIFLGNVSYGGANVTWIPYCTTHGETELLNATEATCTQDGCTGDTVCKVCGETVQPGEIIPATGHTEDTIPGTAATCTANGLTEGKKCTTCGTVTVAQATIPALPHTEETIPAVAATCTADGLTEGKQCTTCGTVTVAQKTVAATGHAWDEGKVTKEPTETAAGEKTYTCKTCKETKTEAIAALGHTHKYTDTVVKPTCTEAGYTTHTCTCGDSYKNTETAALGHTYENGKCTVCGAADPSWQPSEAKPEVTRLAGAHRFETAFFAANQMKQNLGIEKFDTVVVASGMDFADALSGSYLAAVKNAPILLACDVAWINDLVKDYIQENLNPGGTVYILGGTKAIPDSFKTGLEGFDVQRLAGDNRFLTNLKVLEEAGIGDKPILIATGLNFADCLSASAAKQPILLVFGNKLLDDQVTFLEANKGRDLYIIGGTGAVSEKLEEQIKTYGTVERLAGGNRFETSVMIARKFFLNPDTAVLAYAWDFPDGLCGGSLAAAMNAPLILTMPKYEAQATEYIQGQGIRKGYVLGGEKLIPEASADTIFGRN